MQERNLPAINAALWLIPASLWALAVHFTYTYACDIPWWDAWEFTELIAGTQPLTWHAVWEQHNEHRVVWQTLFELAWGKWVRWDQFTASFFPFVLIGAGNCLLIYQTLRRRRHLGFTRRALLLGVLSLLLFTFRQHDHLLWDMMLCWAMVTLAIVLFADAFPRYMAGGDGWGQVAWLGALVVVATLATGQGLAINSYLLVVGALAVVLRRDLPRGYLALAALSAGLIGLYFIGYVKPAHHPPLTAALSDPVGAVKYVTALLGSPFTPSYIHARVVGALVAAVLLVCVAALVKRHGNHALWEITVRHPLIPIGLIVAAVVLAGRLGLGAHQSMASRYVPYTALLVAGVLILALDLLGERRLRWQTPLLASLLLVMLPGWVESYRDARRQAEIRRDGLQGYIDCARHGATPLGECDGSRVYPDPEILERRTVLLRDRGLSFFAE